MYYMSQIVLKLQLPNKKEKNYSHLTILEQDGQKNRNEKTTTVLLRNVFY